MASSFLSHSGEILELEWDSGLSGMVVILKLIQGHYSIFTK